LINAIVLQEAKFSSEIEILNEHLEHRAGEVDDQLIPRGFSVHGSVEREAPKFWTACSRLRGARNGLRNWSAAVPWGHNLLILKRIAELGLVFTTYRPPQTSGGAATCYSISRFRCKAVQALETTKKAMSKFFKEGVFKKCEEKRAG